MAAAAPKPEDRLAFADELAQVRAKDVKGKYKKELDELEVEYQFILLRSLTLFHKEMQRDSLPEKLHEIKEKLTDTVGTFTYQTNLPTTNWNWNNIICKKCRKTSLKPMHCPLKQLIKPMRSSRELKNICQSESQHRLWLTRS